MRWQRWVKALPEQLKRLTDGGWQVRGDAILPSGETVQRFCQAAPLGGVPEDMKRGGELVKRKWLNEREVLRIDKQFQQSCRHGPSAVAYFDKLERVHGNRIRELGRSPKRSAMLELRDRHGRGEPGDKRPGRSGRKRLPIDDRVRAAYADLALHKNNFSHAEAYRYARDVAAELGVSIPSKATMKLDFKRWYPQPAVELAKRPRAFEAKCLPKMERAYTEIAPQEWLSLDGHVLNLRCQAPDAHKSGKSIRPVLTGVLDIRTRMFVGSDIRGTENSNGILAGLKRAYQEYGCARHFYADNGEAYKASLGHRVRPKLYDDPRIGDLCRETGAERHSAIPYQGWAKMIESHWRFVVERFERYFTSWWGNRIDTRPEDAAKLPVWDMPTLDEVRDAWREFLKAHHAEPQYGDGMYGLSPQLAMEQFRSEIRRVDGDVLDFICTRAVGYRKIGRDGVRHNGVLYGQYDEDVFKLQGQKVVVKVDPADAGYVWLYDERTGDVYRAHNRRLDGSSQEDVREAAKLRAKLRRLAKEYRPNRDFLLETTTGQIMRKRAERAEARQAAARAALPAPAEPSVTIVRGDLAQPVKRAQRQKIRRAGAGRTAVAGTSNERRDPFKKLAEIGAQEPPAAESGVDRFDLWAIHRRLGLDQVEPVESEAG
ncbi:MAG: Mu transposase C-terminal domain-containing protein [Planctomycetota bacterium]